MLIFVDGFSHYTDPFLAQKWDIVADSTGTQVVQSVSGVGRSGGGGVVFTPASSATLPNAYIQKNYDGVSTIIAGLAFQQGGTQLVAGGQLISFMDGSTVQVAVRVLQSGQLRIMRNTAAGGGLVTAAYTLLGESTNAINSSSFDFLEFKVIHHATTGSVEIKRNGAAFFTLTNVNTAISGVNNSSSVVIGGFSSTNPITFQELKGTVTDFHLLNTTVDGADALNPVDFIGDRHWEPLTPTADGADTAWTITGSASHFANVDEIPPNTTDFNSTATLNARDGFVVSAPTGPSTASALISLTMYIQKNTGGSNAVKGFMRTPAASYRNGTEFQVPTPWGFRQSFMASKPGGGAITLADIAANQLGYEKTV